MPEGESTDNGVCAMNATRDSESIGLQSQLTAPPARVEGFASKAVRLERRVGWLLWSALLAILIVIST